MSRLPFSLFWLIAPAAMALWLIVSVPSRWFGLDTGAIGAALMLLVAWSGLWLSSRLKEEGESNVSPGEQQAWVALAFTGLIGGLMVYQSNLLLGAKSVADLRELGRPIAMLVVGWIIFSAILRQRIGNRIQHDERDRDVERASDIAGYTSLCIAIMILVVLLGFSPPEKLVWATPLVLANLLVFVLVLANLIANITAISLYRRDRV